MGRENRTSGRAAFGAALFLLVALLGGCTAATPTAPARVADTVPSGAARPPALPALPTDTPPPPMGARPSPTRACPPFAVASAIPYLGWEALIWYSDAIVVGTVVTQDTRWVGSSIITESSVRVAERVRGLTEETITIRQYAGTLDGCTQHASRSPLPRDDLLLLFLKRSDSGATALSYSINWEGYGVYNVGLATSDIPATQRLADIRRILAAPPPTDLSSTWIVPLSRAPLIAPAVATPTR